jgi:predicted dehydrogenase
VSGGPLRVGCIGMGWWSDVLADAIQRSGKLEIVSCFTRSEEKRQAFAAKYRCRPVASYETMLADPRIEAIINTTPNDVHLATTSAAAGKHVFLDKPIANTISDGRAPGDNPDVASLILEYNDGALSTVNASYASASEYYLMNIYGKDATAYYDLHNGLRLLKRGESEPTAIRCA